MEEGILNQSSTPQEKALSLFEFVKELNKLKQQTIVRIGDYPWHMSISDLPDDPEHITVTYRDRVEEEQRNVAGVGRHSRSNPHDCQWTGYRMDD